jgi:hypothetical protein
MMKLSLLKVGVVSGLFVSACLGSSAFGVGTSSGDRLGTFAFSSRSRPSQFSQAAQTSRIASAVKIAFNTVAKFSSKQLTQALKDGSSSGLTSQEVGAVQFLVSLGLKKELQKADSPSVFSVSKVATKSGHFGFTSDGSKAYRPSSAGKRHFDYQLSVTFKGRPTSAFYYSKKDIQALLASAVKLKQISPLSRSNMRAGSNSLESRTDQQRIAGWQQ